MYLDVLANDIAKVFGVHSLITHFPDQFKQAFVFDGTILADNVKPAARPIVSIAMMNENECQLLWSYLRHFYTQLTRKVNLLASYVYNNIVRTPISCIISYTANYIANY